MNKFLLLFLFPVFCYGQGDQTIIQVPLEKPGNSLLAILPGQSESAIVHLPDDYGKTTTRYPLMVFLHGMGEGGKNPATIYNSSTAGGPAYYIAQGKFPASFVNPADGKSYKFIVVSPQSTNGWSTTAPQLENILSYLYKTYRVDTARVYLTGLSAGGEGVLEYVGKLQGTGLPVNATHKIAAFIPMSAVMNAGLRPLYAATIIADDNHIWGFGSPSDTHGANTLNLVLDYVNQKKANYGLTTSYAGGHCCWGQFYNPAFTQNGMNIYQWALQYTKGASALPATVPAANAGSDQTVQLPVSLVTLNGAASTVTNGTIARYAWTQKSGPSTAAIVSPAGASTVVSGLSAGVYTFALTITDNTGKTSTDTILVTVKAASVVVLPANPNSALSIPGIIQAESYSTMSGVATQTTTDGGGGRNVGWIDRGNWMDYTVHVATAGTYTVGFRVATPYTGASFQLKTGSGSVLATIKLNRTGSFQSWQTVSATVVLTAGNQTLQIYSTADPRWNINYMQFVSGASGAQTISSAVSGQSNSLSISMDTTADAYTAPAPVSFAIYPNPVQGEFNLQLNNEYTGNMIVRIVDVSGVVRHFYKFNKNQSSILVNLSAGDLPAGAYFIRVQIGAWSGVKQLFKL